MTTLKQYDEQISNLKRNKPKENSEKDKIDSFSLLNDNLSHLSESKDKQFENEVEISNNNFMNNMNGQANLTLSSDSKEKEEIEENKNLDENKYNFFKEELQKGKINNNIEDKANKDNLKKIVNSIKLS